MMLASEFMIEELAMRVGWTLIHSLWQISLIGAVFWLVNRSLARRSANSRYVAGCVALVLMLVTPICWLAYAYQDHPTFESIEVGPVVSHRAKGNDRSIITPSGSLPDNRRSDLRGPDWQQFERSRAPIIGKPTSRIDASPPNRSHQIARDIAVIWFAGVILLSLRPVLGFAYGRRLCRAGRTEVPESIAVLLSRVAKAMGVRGAVRVAQSTLAQVPCVVGWFRPVILLPASAVTGLTTAELESILAHELAHIRRHDFIVNIAQLLIETLLFFHPVVWWVSRCVRREREHCCDDLALQFCKNREVLAGALLTIGDAKLQPSLALASNGSVLFERVERILEPYEARNERNEAALIQQHKTWIVVMSCLALLALIIGSTFYLRGRSNQTPNSNSQHNGEEDSSLSRNNAMNEKQSSGALPSSRMSKPYWLEGEEMRRDGVVVDGDMAWEMFCACFDGDNDKVRALLTKDPKLVNAQLWYCQPIDGALRHGHLDVVRTIHEFDRENTLAFYIDHDTYRCGKAEMLRRGHTHLVKYFEEEYWPRLVPNWVSELDEIAEFLPSAWEPDKAVDRERLFAMIEQNPDVLKGTTRDGRSLLYVALEIRRSDLAKELVDRGAATDLKTAKGYSVMDIAALRCPDALPWLLELGVEQTLHGAVALADTEAIRTIVQADPDSLHHPRPYVPLALAVIRTHPEIVKLLLSLGADPNHPTENCPWGNPLLEAAQRNNVELIRMLLEAGAYPTPGADSSGSVYDFLQNWDRRTAEEIAEAKELLLEHGADPYEFQVKKLDRLEFIRTASDEELLSPFWDGTFLTGCATPELIDAFVTRFGNDRIVKGPFYEMCKAPWSRKLAETMMRHGYSIDHGDWLGRTELHAAAASNQIERAKYLLEFGANPNLLDAQHSSTPLGFAAREGHVEMVKLLLEHGADRSLPTDDHLAWARPLESAKHFLANHDFRFKGGTSNQGELTGRYTKSPKEKYEDVIKLLK